MTTQSDTVASILCAQRLRCRLVVHSEREAKIIENLASKLHVGVRTTQRDLPEGEESND